MEKLTFNSSELIIVLIKSDLRNNKLISGLHEAGFMQGYFYTDLYMAIFDLMDFKRGDREMVIALYNQKIDFYCKMQAHEFYSRLNELAIQLYYDLLKIKDASS